MNDQYKGPERKYPTDECKAACDQASSCIAIGTHYFCDRLFFSDYETALKEIPDDLCKNWEYTNTKDNSVYCDENGLCGAQEPTNGCFVKQVKSGKKIKIVNQIGYVILKTKWSDSILNRLILDKSS